jgi:hypothetical protein
MKINRDLAIYILKYLDTNHVSDFPFIVMCREYSPEDDDFVEIAPNEWKDIYSDYTYKTFQLWSKTI